MRLIRGLWREGLGWYKINPKSHIAAFALLLGLASTSQAADFYTAIKTPQPGQIEWLSTFSQANKFVDKKGNTVDLDISKWINSAMLKLKNDQWYGSVTVPFAQVDNDTIDQRLSGLGDTGFELGPHFKLGNLFVMPTLNYYLGTGRYDSDRALNLGTGKDWIGGALYFTYLKNDWIFDAYGGLFNQVGGDLYRNRFGGAIGAKKARWIIGGGFDYTQGYGGQKKVTAGPLVRYVRDKWHITFGVEKSLYERNCPDDLVAFARLRIPMGQEPYKKLRNHARGQRNYNNSRKR